ncbi:T-cell-interacting, activating receptor on myeloid cells protein 1-like [Dromiciops gliroides]|uniref:T-cell-interacting, activating receptor on myeloid cells protein 1-like n=1 Tax=Dromiciops gliroides TaxID=33562 RepID=UPI001CC42A0E|nr:T-cell-interacting, activating receptor on myeloid cells protein 1-like [Dromiciops gliroides]
MGPTVIFLFSIVTFRRPTLRAVPSSLVPKGADVTLRCQGRMKKESFQLWKEGKLREERHASWQLAEFVLRSVDVVRDARSYSCCFGQRPWWSELSEPLNLVVTGGLGCRPRTGSPGGDEKGAGGAGTQEPLQHKRSEDTQISFLLTSVRPEDTGKYSCTYRWGRASARGSEPSDTLELGVPGSLPKPSLSALPGLVVEPGTHVTLQCRQPPQSSLWGVTFTLLKVGTPQPLQSQSPAGASADFNLLSVRAQDAGNYSCVYQKRMDPNLVSEPSEVLEIWVTGTVPSNTLIITLSCVSFFLLLCILLLVLLRHGSIPMDTEVAKERSRKPLILTDEDPQVLVTYAQLNIHTLDEKKIDSTKTPIEPTLYDMVCKD